MHRKNLDVNYMFLLHLTFFIIITEKFSVSEKKKFISNEI